jgi:hypothetical protein
MRGRLAIPPTARRVLDQARSDRAGAVRSLEELSLEAQVALVCETPLGRRAELLALLPHPEHVVPLIPEAELCFTARAMGVGDSSWLLELATPEQLVACLDLDAWRGEDPDSESLGAWMGALAETEPAAQLRHLRAIDPELIVRFLRERALVSLKPSGDDDWQPPEGGQTLDAQFYLVARLEGDDLADLISLLHTLFQQDYWLYFRLLQGAIWELPTENEEWARRWRVGRLEDLGFPAWDEAMEIYGHLAPAALAQLPEGESALDVDAWRLPVWMPGLPAEAESGMALFRAIAELDDDERRACFYALVALANRVAVADGLPLGDAESTPTAIAKAARFASLGLEFVATQRRLSTAETLRRASLTRLFRVGANLEPDAARPEAAQRAARPEAAQRAAGERSRTEGEAPDSDPPDSSD